MLLEWVTVVDYAYNRFCITCQEKNYAMEKESLGIRIKAVRNAKGLSQKAFAELLETSNGYICELEKEKKSPGSRESWFESTSPSQQ